MYLARRNPKGRKSRKYCKINKCKRTERNEEEHNENKKKNVRRASMTGHLLFYGLWDIMEIQIYKFQIPNTNVLQTRILSEFWECLLNMFNKWFVVLIHLFPACSRIYSEHFLRFLNLNWFRFRHHIYI